MNMWKLRRIQIIKTIFWIQKKSILYFLKKKNQKKVNNFYKKYNFIINLGKETPYIKSYNTFFYLQNKAYSVKNFYWKNNIINKKIFSIKKYIFLKKSINLYYYIPLNYFYNNNIIKTKILNYNFLIKKGKKLTVFFIWYKLLCLIKNKLKVDVFLFLQLIIRKIMPLIFYHIKYSSGRKYKIPYIISRFKSYKLALQWFFLNTCLRSEPTLLLCLFGELFDSYKLKSKTIKYKYFIYKVIKENRIFVYLFKKKKKWS